MSKAIAIYTGGIHNLVQVAIREDGTLFQRSQEHGRYGYKWTAWSATGEVLGGNHKDNPNPSITRGFSTLRLAHPNDAFINNRALFNERGEIRVRLP